MNADVPFYAARNSTTLLLELLANYTYPFFPVYSAFNGLSIVKYEYTIDCVFVGQSLEIIDFDRRGYIRNRYDDCEHVSFYKMMITVNHARVMILNKFL